MTRRVVITGVGLTSPVGNSFEEAVENCYKGHSTIVAVPEWKRDFGLRTGVGSLVHGFDGKAIPRQLRRSMSRVSLMAVDATRKAISDADLSEELVRDLRTGVSYGSTMGGTSAIESYFTMCGNRARGEATNVLSSTFLQIMSHTCAANIVVAFQVQGRVLSSCVACAASTQSIGMGYEAIKYGLMDRMICGGAEEMHLSVALIFDSLYATSSGFNDTPTVTPRPFDASRDGLVVGEGAGTFILEDFESARKRGAKIYGEIVGFHTGADGSHMTNPSTVGMENVMRGALESAGITPSDVTYVNAHATATPVGDVAESAAVSRLFGDKVAVSSLKGHFGHLMAAAGVVETAVCLGMLRDEVAVPTLHLRNPDPECGALDYVMNEVRPLKHKYILKNSFAFGGINASLVLRKV